MKTLNKFLSVGLIAATLTGCFDRMKELNSNPETVSDTEMEYLFMGATSTYFDYQGRSTLYYKYYMMAQMQYVATYGSCNYYNNDTGLSYKSAYSWASYYSQLFSTTGNALQTVLDQISYMTEEEQAAHAELRAITQIILQMQQWRVVEQYGASVYNEAFKAITEGITYPKYDLGQDVYMTIDSVFKSSIETLSGTAPDGTVEIGLYDFFYGWINNCGTTGGSTCSQLGDYTTQRARWRKFANMFRLEMAWKLKNVDPDHYTTVLNEVLSVSDGIMESRADGLYFNYPLDAGENTDDITTITQYNAITDTYLNAMHSLNDPRLPYMARTNSVKSNLSQTYRIMQQHYPDTLAKYSAAIAGLLEDGIYDDGNVYIGMTPNPQFQDLALTDAPTDANPNFASALLENFVLDINDSKGEVRVDGASKLLVTTDDYGNEETYEIAEDEFTLYFQLCSPSQGRYFVKCGGSSNGTTYGGNYTVGVSETYNLLYADGVGSDWDDMVLRRPIFTYVQQCFMFAYLGITAGGKSPEQWFQEGVTNALEELREDALRYKIQIAVDASFPEISDQINPGGGTYTYTDDDIATYLAQLTYSPEEAINQAWMYFYQMPEVAYQWWKMTGYPTMVDVNTPEEAAAKVGPYLVQPYNAYGVVLNIPRRNELSSAITTNEDSWNTVVDELTSQSMFGSTMENTSGRVWWDTLGM